MALRNKTRKILKMLKRKGQNISYKIRRAYASKNKRAKLLENRFALLKERFKENNPNWEKKNTRRALDSNIKATLRLTNKLQMGFKKPQPTRKQINTSKSKTLLSLKNQGKVSVKNINNAFKTIGLPALTAKGKEIVSNMPQNKRTKIMKTITFKKENKK